MSIYVFIFQQEAGARHYPAVNVVIRKRVLDILLKWNKTEAFNVTLFDSLFVNFMLIEIFGTEALKTGSLDEKKLDFMEQIYENRVKDDEVRKRKFRDYVIRKVNESANPKPKRC